MDPEKLLTLSQVFLNIEKLSTTAWVYISAEEKWNLDSKCAVLESEEVSLDEEDDPDASIPEFAKQHQLQQVLSVAGIQDIVSNAKAQKADATLDDLFRAFLFYHKNDAFINLRK